MGVVVRDFSVNVLAVPHTDRVLRANREKKVLERMILNIPEGFLFGIRPHGNTVILSFEGVSIGVNLRDGWYVPNPNASFNSRREQK